VGTYIILLVIAVLLNLAAFIWLVIAAFKRSVLWGILVFFFSPLAALIFAITNWFDAKKPFLAYVLTTILMFVPLGMMSSSFDAQHMQRISEKVETGEIKENEVIQYIMNPELLDELDKKVDGDGEVVLDEFGEPVLDAPDSAGAAKDEWVDIKPVVVDPDKAPADKKSGDKTQKDEPDVIVEEEEPSRYPKAGEAKPDPLAIKRKEVPIDSVKVSPKKIANYKGRYFVVTTKDSSQHRGILIKVTKTRIELRRKLYGGTFTYKIRRSKIKRLDMLKKEYVDDGK